jgi:uncharacterized membrane protein (UPF0127 family)
MKPLKSGLLLIGSCLLLIPNLSLAQNIKAEQQQGQKLPITAKATIGKEIVELEVARTPKQLEIGLMFRRSLAANRGMLFLFNEPLVPNFWMKNTLIPLDIVFLRQGVIQAILPQIPPCLKDPCPVYNPQVTADQVIELASGRAKKLGLKKSNSLTIHFLTTP